MLSHDEMLEVKDWWSHVYTEDGQLDEPAVLAELHDYQHVAEEASKVYWTISNGALSKPNYYASTIIAVYEEQVEELIRDSIREALKRVKNGESVDELLEEFHD